MPISIRPRHVAMTTPYAAVVIGIHWLGSAWLTILLYHGGIALYLLFVRRGSLKKSLFRGWNTATGVGTSLLCALCGPLLIILWPTVSIAPGSLSSTLADLGLHGVSWWLFAVYYVSVNSVLEEVFWRGGRSSRNKFVAVSDVAYAGYHVLVLPYFLQTGWVFTVSIILVIVAWLWRRMAGHYHGLAMLVISHAVAGLSTIAAACFLARG